MSTPAFTASDDIVHFIAGQATPAKSTRFSDVFNPATGLKSRRVALASAADVATAVTAAQKAFGQWADTPPSNGLVLCSNF